VRSTYLSVWREEFQPKDLALFVQGRAGFRNERGAAQSGKGERAGDLQQSQSLLPEVSPFCVLVTMNYGQNSSSFSIRNDFPTEFNIHGSVHRKNILIYIQRDATLNSLFYLETALHISGGITTHHQESKQLYLQRLVIVTPLLLPVASGR
jgi:hypothetical protein